ncbi:hypothetical protein L596_027374 [Steinernema carpocapsae]|uniref:Uncharacterized protein n=1 Tax=Steinernema carpocapsae TaxID=34508 RepID=A0A4U5M457_STECR|nr:hypothetical protein L596_027374 [Steinernema carpocapsae]
MWFLRRSRLAPGITGALFVEFNCVQGIEQTFNAPRRNVPAAKRPAAKRLAAKRLRRNVPRRNVPRRNVMDRLDVSLVAPTLSPAVLHNPEVTLIRVVP